MSESLTISPRGPLQGVVRPPGSKSITNRALVCAALADGESHLSGALVSEDTAVMVESLQRLAQDHCVVQRDTSLKVTGFGGTIPARRADLFVGNSGTTIRFLTAITALGHGDYRLDGVARMRQRPIGDLLDALNQLGASAISESGNGCPPVVLKANGLDGGNVRVRGDISSQFLSGLLMAAPYAKDDVEIMVEGELVSKPYVAMTTAIMEAFGVRVESDGRDRFRIASGQRYLGRAYDIEPDASAASYFWGAAAISGGQVAVTGLNRDSLQGDVAFCDCLSKMGCVVDYSNDSIIVRGGSLHGIEIDMNAISDTVPTLAAVALFANRPTTITGVAHIRHKETDRIGDLARELRKLGAMVDELPDGLRINPRPLKGCNIETYNDHRMAMSLALVGLRVPNVTILNPRCVEKTYPQFFRDLAALEEA